MHGEEVVERARGGGPNVYLRLGPRALEQHPETGGSFGMIGAGIVPDAVGVGEDGDGHDGELAGRVSARAAGACGAR